jgi:hypothetical protein
MKLTRRALKYAKSTWRKKPEMTGRHYRVARRMLLDIVDVCNEMGVPYHIDYGTLLGLVRDGDLIPWDHDMDMSIMAPDLKTFRKTFWRLRLRGWRINANSHFIRKPHPAWKANSLRSIKIRNRNFLFFGRGRVVMDVFIKYPHEGFAWWKLLGENCRAPLHHFEGYETIDYGGRKVHVPRDYEKYLEHLYGADWRTPKRNFNSFTDDGSIVRETTA